jgi:ABC-2 type transport system ATP-binding protein
LIAVEHLTKFYGSTRAVDDVSFSVGAGEVAALLGPNGSGKSTVMRCLIGYFSPTAGRLRVGGVDVAERPVAARRQVGYLPEQVMMYPDLTVRRYLAFVAEVKGIRGAARRRAVGDVLEQCSLADVADRHTGKLSKGYRQRVGLAQALLGDPEVLVLDEPTVGLDPVQTVEMRRLIQALRGRTVLLSTHILSEAAAVCSRVVILSRGRLVAEDTAEGLARRIEGLGHLTVRVEGPADDVATALAALPGVAQVTARPPDGGAGHLFTMTVPDPLAVQRQLGAAVLARGWVLLELRSDAPSLEDLFVRLVNRAVAGSA